jgi:hypothetical protein
MATWKQLIEDEFKYSGDTWGDVVSSTLSEDELNEEFDNGWGLTQGKFFTLWTTKYAYFPVMYDGSEWAGYVSRNPDGVPTEHVGG